MLQTFRMARLLSPATPCVLVSNGLRFLCPGEVTAHGFPLELLQDIWGKDPKPFAALYQQVSGFPATAPGSLSRGGYCISESGESRVEMGEQVELLLGRPCPLPSSLEGSRSPLAKPARRGNPAGCDEAATRANSYPSSVAGGFCPRPQVLFVLVDVNGEGVGVLQYFGLKAHDAPALRFINIEANKKYRLATEGLTAHGLHTFCQEVLQGKIQVGSLTSGKGGGIILVHVDIWGGRQHP